MALLPSTTSTVVGSPGRDVKETRRFQEACGREEIARIVILIMASKQAIVELKLTIVQYYYNVVILFVFDGGKILFVVSG